MYHDEADAEAAEQVIVDTQDDDRDQRDTQADTYDMKQARREGQKVEPAVRATVATVDDSPASPSQQELPETTEDERGQELEAYEESEEDNELAILKHHPEQVEEATGNARLVDSSHGHDRTDLCVAHVIVLISLRPSRPSHGARQGDNPPGGRQRTYVA